VSTTRSTPALPPETLADPPEAPVRPRIAVIGGGAAGTLAAVHLMREAHATGIEGAEIVLIDSRGVFGPGIPYATSDPFHLLNVPAVRMGGISGQPEHFHAWLQRRGSRAAPEAFLPRGLFGGYLHDLLDEAEAAGAGSACLTRVEGEVLSLSETKRSPAPLEIALADGRRLWADRAMLAIGPPPGGDPTPVPAELRDAGVYVADPWTRDALAAAATDESVLIVGTGLTMVDVALSLGRSEPGPTMRAVSRHGLVPRTHRRELTRIEQFPLPRDARTLEPVIVAMLEQIGRVAQRGGDWRDVFDSMRSSTPAIWRSLDTDEKRRFLASLQRFWDVHRFRMAPAVAERFAELQDQGRLRVDACSVAALEPRGSGARVSLRAAGQHALETVDVDRVINCTGAGADLTRGAPPLLASLLAAGTARADALSLGLEVDPDGALIDAAGRASELIHVIGALRKGVEWEAIGVTEIRDHAARAARLALAAHVAAGTGR